MKCRNFIILGIDLSCNPILNWPWVVEIISFILIWRSAGLHYWAVLDHLWLTITHVFFAVCPSVVTGQLAEKAEKLARDSCLTGCSAYWSSDFTHYKHGSLCLPTLWVIPQRLPTHVCSSEGTGKKKIPTGNWILGLNNPIDTEVVRKKLVLAFEQRTKKQNVI